MKTLSFDPYTSLVSMNMLGYLSIDEYLSSLTDEERDVYDNSLKILDTLDESSRVAVCWLFEDIEEALSKIHRLSQEDKEVLRKSDKLYRKWVEKQYEKYSRIEDERYRQQYEAYL